MNELTPPPEKKSRLNKIIVAVLLVVLAVAGLGYYVSKAGLDKALIKQTVDAWIERREASAAGEGYQLDITYDDVAIKGGLTDGHALLSNLKITTSSVEDGAPISFTTPEVKLTPKSTDLQNMEIEVPAPIHVFEGKNTYESAALTSDSSLLFALEQVEQDDVSYNKISHVFPSKITFKFLVGQEAKGEEEKAPDLAPRYESIEVTIQKGNAQVTTHPKHSNIGNSQLELKRVVIVPVGQEVGTVEIERFSSEWSNALDDKNLNNILAKIELENLTADPKFMPYAPINASVDVRFEGAMPSTPEEFTKIQSQQTALKLKQFSFSTKDASLNATADFVANQDDILPIGMANVSIGNVQSWRGILKENGIINEKTEQLVNTLFIRIAEQTLPESKDVSIDIQRAREGSFQIGNITFEEVLAILLGGVKTPLDTKLPAPTDQAAPVDAVKTE